MRGSDLVWIGAAMARPFAPCCSLSSPPRVRDSLTKARSSSRLSTFVLLFTSSRLGKVLKTRMPLQHIGDLDLDVFNYRSVVMCLSLVFSILSLPNAMQLHMLCI